MYKNHVSALLNIPGWIFCALEHVECSSVVIKCTPPPYRIRFLIFIKAALQTMAFPVLTSRRTSFLRFRRNSVLKSQGFWNFFLLDIFLLKNLVVLNVATLTQEAWKAFEMPGRISYTRETTRKPYQPMFLPQCESKMMSKIVVLIILSFNFWIANWKAQDSTLNDSKHSFLWPVPKFCINWILFCSGCSQISALFHYSNHLLSIFIL